MLVQHGAFECRLASGRMATQRIYFVLFFGHYGIFVNEMTSRSGCAIRYVSIKVLLVSNNLITCKVVGSLVLIVWDLVVFVSFVGNVALLHFFRFLITV